MTEATRRGRPVIVTLLGALFVLMGAVMLPAAIIGLTEFAVMGNVFEPLPSSSPGTPGPGDLFSPLFRYFWLLALVQLGVGAFTLVAAIRFLQLRAWARPALEVLVWLGILFTVAFGVLWIVNWLRITANVSDVVTGESAQRAFTLVGAMTGVLVILSYGIIAGLFVWALRSKTVRDAMLPGGATPPPIPPEVPSA